MSLSGLNLEKFLIPLEEIKLATKNFSPKAKIRFGGSGTVYKGQLSGRWQGRVAAFKRHDPEGSCGEEQFRNEVEMISGFHHENIISFIGYCDEGNEMIIVTNYAVNGSLGDYLFYEYKRSCLTWVDRLKICIGAARGLKYLHSGLRDRGIVIHGNFKSGKILLDGNMEAKVCGFGFSKSVDSKSQPQKSNTIAGTPFYMDPIYQESGKLMVESDAYSFGVLLFEILTGLLAYRRKSIGDDEPQYLINMVQHYHEDGVDKLIDPHIRDQIDSRSLDIFTEIAYKCISLDLKDRPTVDRIIDFIQIAFDTQELKLDASTINIKSHRQYRNLKNFLIPLEEIMLATKNFSPETVIGSGGFGTVYKGQLSGRWQGRIAAFKRHDPEGFHGEEQFRNEVEMIASFHHENIISFIGYCDEGNEMIVVTNYAVNGCLEDYLFYEDKRSCITWANRLKICIGAARGLKYLHSGLGDRGIVIHRNFKSAKILLDDNMEAKVCGFGFSTSIVSKSQPQESGTVAGSLYYIDPIHVESGNLMVESDAYSFGVILFEILTGWLAYLRKSIGDDKPQYLMNMVQHYHEDGVDKLIDPHIRDQIDSRSLDIFKEIAYKCISLDLEDRPTVDMIIDSIEKTFDAQELKEDASPINLKSRNQFRKFENFLIPLEEIMRATNNFSPENLISKGDYGSVIYEGQLSEHWRNRKAAIYRYHPNAYQVEHMFLDSLKKRSNINHENIIRFIGYCGEGDERVIVYGYPDHGSLDDHLQDPRMRRCITWAQPLKICIGAAKALNYIHVGVGKDRLQLIHEDFNSHVILLDENMEAKISFFGLSKLGPRDQTRRKRDVGFQFYLDPMFYETGFMGKKSDIYSFGVVMFEMLSGMMVHYERGIGDDKPQTLINLARRYYGNGLEKLTDPCISGQIDGHSFHTFTEIAYQCISFNRKERPKMDTIIKQIEEALDTHNRRAASSIAIQSHQYQTTMSSSSVSLVRFLIPLREIHLATRNFNPKAQIGDGEFSFVYRGKLPEPWNNQTVAIKRFGRNNYKHEEEFHNELKMISRFEHENIIPFVGYYNEGNEMIIVSKYATNGSLDHLLQDPWKSRHITWAQRLKICLGAAKGIRYLHSGHKEHCMIIHRDINSSNILLYDELEAKICGFSLSVLVPANQQHSKIYTNVAGTPSYTDPIHIESGILSTASDVYSFGIVLFEMLCGMLVSYTKSIGEDK